MNAEEKSIASKISRRGFMGVGVTAAATLAALTGREPQLVRAADPKATADSIIVLWMAGGMAQTETFDPKRYTPFEPGVRTERVLSTFPAIDTVGRQHQDLAGAGARRQGDGSRLADPHVPGPPTSASSSTRAISFTGTRATFRRNRWPCRTSAR